MCGGGEGAIEFELLRVQPSSFVLLPVKGRKWLADGGIMYTSAAHADFIHDITDLVKMATLTAVFSRLSDVA